MLARNSSLGIMKISLLKTGLLMLMRPWLWSVRPLRISDLLDNPIDQFEKWFNRAKRCLSLEFPEAMCLSTLGTDGYPEAVSYTHLTLPTIYSV